MKNELKSIKKASFFKRILAIIMDGSVAIFTFFAFFELVFSPIAIKAFGYRKLVNEASEFQMSSQLYVLLNEKDNRNTPINYLDDQTPEFFKEKLHFYYCEFKTGTAEAKAPDYNVEITNENGDKVMPVDYYTESWFETNVASKITDTKSGQNASYDALVDFSKYLKGYQTKIKRIELFMIMPSFFITFGGYFILVPLLYQNGETFGKKIMGLGFVTKDGYSVKKRQMVLRQLFMLFLTAFICFTITIGWWSLVFLAFGVFVYYLATFISKTNRSPADYLAYTYLIDAKNSVWFKDIKEEEEKERILEENLEKYNKYEAENKNIIQVGSKIVDEDIKKEIEESKSEKSREK